MLETIITLLERFVVAHEKIADKPASTPLEEHADRLVKQFNDIEAREKETHAKALAIAKGEDEEPEDKPAKKTRAPRKAAEPKGPDLDKLRDEIKKRTQVIATRGSDDIANKVDDLFIDFDVRTAPKLSDSQVEDFSFKLGPVFIEFLRYEIKQMDDAITKGKDRKAIKELDTLLDNYDVSNAGGVEDVADESVEAFHTELKAIVEKYFNIED